MVTGEENGETVADTNRPAPQTTYPSYREFINRPVPNDKGEREALVKELFGDWLPYNFLFEVGLDLSKPSIEELRKAAENFILKDYKRLLALKCDTTDE